MRHPLSLRAALIGAGVLVGVLPADPPKVLMFTKSAGFEHPVVRREAADKPSQAERIVIELGKKHGFDVTATKDGRMIVGDNLKNYKGLFFLSQGDVDQAGLDKNPPVPKEQRDTILEFVKNGGGFVGTHCGGADTWHGWTDGKEKPFLKMVGGEFISHGAQQVATVEVVDRKFPAVKHFPANFTLNDEWYAYRGFHGNMRVLMMLKTEGMKGKDYARPSYPITWCSTHHEGRVFYTGMGHREDVWDNPAFQTMVAEGVKWSLKLTEGDATPNLKELFGDEKAALERINPPGG
jgi:hypothetical protein